MHSTACHICSYDDTLPHSHPETSLAALPLADVLVDELGMQEGNILEPRLDMLELHIEQLARTWSR